MRKYDLEALRNSVAMVLQKNELFHKRQHRRKPALGQRGRHRRGAAGRLPARPAPMSSSSASPTGYETHIEQGGTNVSGGQKQRLCIARALLKKPKILILDDSTSAVDTATDAKIRKSFAEKIPGTTVFIIAQRISSVENADHVLVLDRRPASAAGARRRSCSRTNARSTRKSTTARTKGGGEGDFDRERRRGSNGRTECKSGPCGRPPACSGPRPQVWKNPGHAAPAHPGHM